MEQAARADKPYFAMISRFDLADPTQELAVAVITIMSECAARWIEPVQPIAFGSKPKEPPLSWAMLLTEAPPRLFGLPES